MQTVFLAGPLTWIPLLEAVLAERVTTESRVAKVKGVGLSRNNVCFPALVVSETDYAEGVVCSVNGHEAFARLSFFADVVGLVPVPKHIEIDGRVQSTVAFVSTTESAEVCSDWDVDQWVKQWGAVACEAAQEIMGYCARQDARSLDWRMQMILARAAARVGAVATPMPTQIRSATSAESVRVSDVRTPHEGFFLTRQYRLRHTRFDGTESEALQREVFVATDAVVVLPYDPIRDRVLLVEQFRMGPFGRGDPHPWVLEPIAGRVDAGETLENAAKRECQEEAGLALSDLEHINSHYCSPGCSTEFFHCYLAIADLPDTAMQLGGLAEEHEDIRCHVVDFDVAMQLVTSGEANIGPLVLMLLWLQRERPRLRSLA